jgi:hypothetical protein
MIIGRRTVGRAFNAVVAARKMFLCPVEIVRIAKRVTDATSSTG